MFYDFSKRMVDIVGSVVGLVIFGLPMVLIAVAIKLDSAGPVFADTPKRVSKNGKLFKMYKFRSMVTGAWRLLQQNPELLKKYKENNYKLSTDEDPRITKVGKFIRKTSLDELPQFLNIFKGEMSIVGPRAYYPFELAEQQKKFPESKKYVDVILTEKPGLTGLWQISGRSNINFDARVKLDAEYVLKRSIVFDMIIIMRTVPAIITGRGAV